MDDTFWSGIVGALVGAVIGGAFSTAAAFIGLRGALAVARSQAEATAASNRAVQLRQLRISAATDAASINHRAYQTLLSLLRGHLGLHRRGRHEGECFDVPDDFRYALGELDNFVYSRVKLLPREIREHFDRLQDRMQLLADKDAEMLSKEPDAQVADCIYVVSLERACEESERAGFMLANFLSDEVESAELAEAEAVQKVGSKGSRRRSP